MMTRGGFLARFLAAPLVAVGLKRFGGTATVEVSPPSLADVYPGREPVTVIYTTSACTTTTTSNGHTFWVPIYP